MRDLSVYVITPILLLIPLAFLVFLLGCSRHASEEVVGGIRKDLKKELEAEYQKEPKKLNAALQSARAYQFILTLPLDPKTLTEQIRAGACTFKVFKDYAEILPLTEKVIRETFDTPEKARVFFEWSDRHSGQKMQIDSREEKYVCD